MTSDIADPLHNLILRELIVSPLLSVFILFGHSLFLLIPIPGLSK